MSRLKHLADLVVEKLPANAELPRVDLEHIEGFTGSLLIVEADLFGAAGDRLRFLPGDVLVSKLRPYLGKAFVAEFEGAASSELIVLRPRRGVCSRWLGYNLLSQPFISHARATSAGVKMPRTSPEAVVNFRVQARELPEQRRIADYLDHETARIDDIIEKNDRVSALLKERVRSSIDKMLREAPGPATQLRRVAELIPGHAFKSESFVTEAAGAVRLVRGINVTPSGIDWSAETAWLADLPEGLDRYELRPGDLVVGMDRPWISTGLRAARITEEDVPSFLVQRVLRVIPGDQLDRQYCLLALRSDRFYSHFEPDMTGISVPHVSAEQIGSFRLPVPSVEEQWDRAREVLATEARARGMSEALTLQNALLRERRQALITAAVTGQLDLGEAA